MTLPKCSKCGFPVCSCATPRAISERAKKLWEDLNPVIGNEQAWEIIQKALDAEREAFGMGGFEACTHDPGALAFWQKRSVDESTRANKAEAMLDWLL